MAKIKKRKDSSASSKSGSSTTEDKVSKGKYWRVDLDGSKQGAVIKGDFKSEVKDKFLDLFGIIGTEQKIIALEVDYKHGIAVREFGKNKLEADCHFRGEGIIDYFHRGVDNREKSKAINRKANAANDEPDDEEDE